MPTKKQSCQILYRLASQFNFDEHQNRISLTRQPSVDSAGARKRVCSCFALARLVALVTLLSQHNTVLKEKAVGCF